MRLLETAFQDVKSSHDDEETDSDNEDNSSTSIALSSYRCRGRALDWVKLYENDDDDVGLSFENIEDAHRHARSYDLSKCGSSTSNTFSCRIKGCPFKMKFSDEGDERSRFFCYTVGSHDHEEDVGDIIQRGLCANQKALVEAAFQQGFKSSRNILEFFQRLRKRKTWGDYIRSEKMPRDPKKSVLNNYIQAVKKKNSAEYDPTPKHLKEWCEQHSPSIVDVSNQETFNTPFVLGYNLVSFYIM